MRNFFSPIFFSLWMYVSSECLLFLLEVGGGWGISALPVVIFLWRRERVWFSRICVTSNYHCMFLISSHFFSVSLSFFSPPPFSPAREWFQKANNWSCAKASSNSRGLCLFMGRHWFVNNIKTSAQCVAGSCYFLSSLPITTIWSRGFAQWKRCCHGV